MKRVRSINFGPRSSLPTSAVCVVANGVRETLSSLLGAPASVRIDEPSIPPAHAWAAIVRGALLYRVRGSVADAAIVLRAVDAAAIVAGAFGETDAASHGRTLSPIEREVVDRTVNALARNLAAICGARDGSSAQRVVAIGGFVTYFELLLEEPVTARIGIALSRDPEPEPRGRVELRHLAAVRIGTVGSIDLGTLAAGAAASLAPGATVPLTLADLQRCTLRAHGRGIARGRCGVSNGRYAVAVDSMRAPSD
jgi:flagellar motor switch protein FliM